MILLPGHFHMLYFGIWASALAVQHGQDTSTTSSLVRHAIPLPQTPTTMLRKDALQDPTSTSTDDYPPVALQSAPGIARPSRAVTSLATGLSGVHVEPQSYSLNGSHSAPAPELRTQGSTGLPFYHAGVITSQLPGGTTGPRLLVTTPAITNSTAGFGHIIVAVDQVASKVVNLTCSSPSGSNETMSGSRPQDESDNALSVLLAALPSDVASSIEAGFNVVTHELFATSSAETTRSTTLSSHARPTDQITTSRSRPGPRPTTSRENERPTSRYTAKPNSDVSSSRPTRRPEKSHTSSSNTSRPTTLATRHSTTPKPKPTSTPSTMTSSTSTSTPSTTQPPPTAQDSSSSTTKPAPEITPEKQNINGTIAGIATGSTAALVLLTLAIFFLLRRRRRQNALKAITAKADQPYPEVAFLYDPVQSPPRSRSPAPLLGDQNAGTGAGSSGVVGSRRESTMTAQRSSLLAPEAVVMPEGEHLLAPGRAASRENSPSGIGRAR